MKEQAGHPSTNNSAAPSKPAESSTKAASGASQQTNHCQICIRFPLILRPKHPTWSHYSLEAGKLLRWEAIILRRATKHELDIWLEIFNLRRGRPSLEEFRAWTRLYQNPILWDRNHVSIDHDSTKLTPQRPNPNPNTQTDVID